MIIIFVKLRKLFIHVHACSNNKDINNLYNVSFLLFEDRYMSSIVRKQAFCICENKDADQLRGNREADQRLCFRYIDSTIPLLLKYKISRP